MIVGGVLGIQSSFQWNKKWIWVWNWQVNISAASQDIIYIINLSKYAFTMQIGCKNSNQIKLMWTFIAKTT